MRLPQEPDIPPQINVVPMIDVVFALLTFFIMSTLYLTKSEGLPVNLPKAETSKSQSKAPLVITIDKAGQLALNKQAVTLENLDGQIQNLMKTGKEATVVIKADAEVNHGRVIAVMDQVRRINGAKLAIATQRP
jgi:biopolymer transport protein ExbD